MSKPLSRGVRLNEAISADKMAELDFRLSILQRGAPLLYGERWKRSLARLIGVSEKTLHRWLSGESNTIPPSAVRKLDSEIELHYLKLSQYLYERTGKKS